MEVGDCSLWHHLIFCEELLHNDEENDVVCSQCKESVLGCPAYKCLECNFFQHQSCPESPYHKRHHLIMVEEVENGGKEEVVCPGCLEPASGPAYKCSFYPQCTFFLHKLCTQLSHVIQHPMHPEHTLFSKSHRVIVVMFAAKIARDPSSTVVPLVILTWTSNVFPVGELVPRTATNTPSFPCGSRYSSLVKLVLRKAMVSPTNAASAES